MDNLITIQVTDDQLAALQVLVAESAADTILLEQALAVPIPAAPDHGSDSGGVWFICAQCKGKVYLIGTFALPPSDRMCQQCERLNRSTEQKYCAHCDGGISEGPNEGDGSQFTCPECGGFFHRYRLGCHPDKFHAAAEPLPCDHPPGRSGDVGVGFCELCDCILWGPPPKLYAEADPAVAQLQRVAKQAGIRLWALEQQIGKQAWERLESIHAHGTSGIGHGFLIDRLSILEGRVAALEADKRNAPWLEVWGSNPSAAPNLYSALMVADALDLSYDYVREKLARHCGDDEPDEVAEPVDSPYRHPDGDPKYDLDT